MSLNNETPWFMQLFTTVHRPNCGFKLIIWVDSTDKLTSGLYSKYHESFQLLFLVPLSLPLSITKFAPTMFNKARF